jgi:hypothetical protein
LNARLTGRFHVAFHLAVASLGVALPLGCSHQLSEDVSGKACSSEGRCLPGYSCNAARICVISTTTTVDGGADASLMAPDAGPLPPVEQGDAQAASNTDGSVGDASMGPEGPVDAAVPLPFYDSGSTSCDVYAAFYRDSDGDDVGDTSTGVLACEAPGDDWVSAAGDCREDLASVYSGQDSYFASGYSDPTKPQSTSFDYDCSGSETGDPENPGGAFPGCPGTVLGCSGSGYEATGRSGSGINALCGSDQFSTCVVVGGISCQKQTITSTPYRCR